MDARTQVRPSETPELLSAMLAWIERERDLQRPRAQELSFAQHDLLSNYFDDVLEDVRVRITPRIAIPQFAWSLEAAADNAPHGRYELPVLTLVDTIVISEAALSRARPLLSALFQGCVRAQLYRLYGVRGFVEAYIEQCRYGRAPDCVSFGRLAELLCERFENEALPFDVRTLSCAALYVPLRPVATCGEPSLSQDHRDALADLTALRRLSQRMQR